VTGGAALSVAESSGVAEAESSDVAVAESSGVAEADKRRFGRHSCRSLSAETVIRPNYFLNNLLK
jgi:hypothetical protein